MLVAVEVGKLPWTPETDWGTTKFKADICGPKDWDADNKRAIPCSGIATGSLNITDRGIYDIYYVKYNGKSEFGVDKGYGKDFMKLNQQVCTYNDTTKCGVSNVQAVAQNNLKNQTALVQQISAASDLAFTAQKKAAESAAAQKEAAIVANNTKRIVSINFELSGFGAEYIQKDEKSEIEKGENQMIITTIIAEFTCVLQ